MVTEKQIREKLKEVEDPHIGVNVVDLGFIRQIEIEDGKTYIKMTLTTPACPMAQMLMGKVKAAAESVPETGEVEVELETDPLWSPEEMSDEAKEKLEHLF